MIEALVNTLFTTVIVGPDNSSPPGTILYNGSATSSNTVTTIQQGNTSSWSLSFTPTTTGLYTLVAFGEVQFRLSVVPRSLYSYLINIEDEALGSWEWDKETGVLTFFRQDGSTLQAFTAEDTLTSASRERS